MAHAHSHNFESNSKKLYIAIFINVILTLFQIVGGILAGSLSLLADAMASVAVIIAGILIIYFQWYVVDLIATAIISIYVIYHGAILLRKAILILMEATPEEIDIDKIKAEICTLDQISSIAHVHVWEISDKRYMFTANLILVDKNQSMAALQQVKQCLVTQFNIEHTTLEVIDTVQDNSQCD